MKGRERAGPCRTVIDDGLRIGLAEHDAGLVEDSGWRCEGSVNVPRRQSCPLSRTGVPSSRQERWRVFEVSWQERVLPLPVVVIWETFI